jgi:hypothetical protein
VEDVRQLDGWATWSPPTPMMRLMKSSPSVAAIEADSSGDRG